jgi:glucose/arabinose dehydrogenase
LTQRVRIPAGAALTSSRTGARLKLPAYPGFADAVPHWTLVISSFGLVFNTGDLFPASRGSALIGGLSVQALVGVAIERGEGGAPDRISHGAGWSAPLRLDRITRRF